MQIKSEVSRRKGDSSSSFHPPSAWIAIALFCGFAIACLLGGGASVLRLGFPAGALLVGILLYFKSPALYIGFTWWLWFLTPLVRRLVDFQAGWQDPNTILLAPYLATLVTTLTLIQCLPKIHLLNGLPFLLPIVAVVYALFIGLIQYSPTGVLVAFLDWFVPLTFGFHLFANWRHYKAYCKTLQQAFLWSTLIMGAYGVWQFLTAPEWDRYWLVNSDAAGFGQPLPLEMRVWGTMHSPGPFAVNIMVGLLILLHSSNKLSLLSSGVGYLALLLSQVRAVWLGGVVGLLSLIGSLKPGLQIRLLITVLVLALCVAPLATIEPYSGIIAARLESFSSITSDGSYQARASGYQELFGLAAFQVLGKGLGYVIKHGSFGPNDSGILTLMFTLGWLGTLLYLGGLMLLLLRTFQRSNVKYDPLFYAFRAISLAVIVQIGLGSVMLEVYGVILWGFLGMAMAGRKYSHYHHQLEEFHNYASSGSTASG